MIWGGGVKPNWIENNSKWTLSMSSATKEEIFTAIYGICSNFSHSLTEGNYLQTNKKLQQCLEPKILTVFKDMEIIKKKLGRFKYKKKQAALRSCHLERKT